MTRRKSGGLARVEPLALDRKSRAGFITAFVKNQIDVKETQRWRSSGICRITPAGRCGTRQFPKFRAIRQGLAADSCLLQLKIHRNGCDNPHRLSVQKRRQVFPMMDGFDGGGGQHRMPADDFDVHDISLFIYGDA